MMRRLDFVWVRVADPKLDAEDRKINGVYTATLLLFYFFYTLFGDRRRVGGSMAGCTIMAGINYWLMLRWSSFDSTYA